MKALPAQFFALLLLFAFTFPQFVNALHLCGDNKVKSSMAANVDQHAESAGKKVNGPKHCEDCSCPTHRTGCTHTGVFLPKEQQPNFDLQALSQAFIESLSLIKPSPFLDGPFQPPRA